MIGRLEFDLSKVRAEIIDAQAEPALRRTRADSKMAIRMKDIVDAQDELK